MATVVQTTLLISESTVEQYCTADGLSLNTGGYAIRLYLNGHTQGSAILNDAAKEVLYPSATAHPFKIDSFMRANKSGGNMTISLQFNEADVHSESSGWSTGLKDKTKEAITDSIVTDSNRSTEIKWHIKGSSTVSRFSIASTKLAFYFNQYTMQSLVGDGANGIQETTVSNASPYQGDTVVFSPKLVQGATWAGWYSDAACTNLVSTDQNYSVSPTSDLTLYAKATHEESLFSCAAIAGAGVSSVSVSDVKVPANGTCLFVATVKDGYDFDGWYSDSNCTNLISSSNPYTASITADTTLYAHANIQKFEATVGQTAHGNASVTPSIVEYGGNATFAFVVEDNEWEFDGWYSDDGLTQLVSSENPYACSVFANIKLYPKATPKMYTIKLTRGLKSALGQTGTWTLKIAALYYEQLTYEERQYIKTGEFDKIEASKVYSKTEKTGGDMVAAISASLKVPANTTCVLWDNLSSMPVTCFAESGDISIGEREMLTYWPYYIFKPTQDKEYFCYYSDSVCICAAVAKRGILYADATTPTFAGKNAIFTAEVKDGYVFSGWYSDEECTTLASQDNPLFIATPTTNSNSSDPQDDDASASKLTLYARGQLTVGESQVLYFKNGGTYISVSKVYKKASGKWLKQDDLTSLFPDISSSGASDYVYGGNM